MVNDLGAFKGILPNRWSCTAILRCFVGNEHSSAHVEDDLKGTFFTF